MHKIDRPFDSRIRGMHEQVKEVEDGLVEAGECIACLPEQRRAEVIAAMDRVFKAGLLLGALKQQPVSVTMKDNEMLLGPDLRAHLREVEVVQNEIGNLRRVAQQVFHERSARHIRSTMRKAA